MSFDYVQESIRQAFPELVEGSKAPVRESLRLRCARLRPNGGFVEGLTTNGCQSCLFDFGFGAQIGQEFFELLLLEALL